MGLFDSFINDLISNNAMNKHIHNFSRNPYGKPDCHPLNHHVKQQISDSSSTIFNNRTPIIAALSMNNSNSFRTSIVKTSKKNRPTTRSQKARNSSLSDDEERLLEYLLDAYIVYKGSEVLMIESLSQKLNTDMTKMKILCQTLCQLIEIKIQ